MSEHPYRFRPPVSRWSRIFNARPSTSGVTVVDGRMIATFGPWTVASDLANIATASLTGPYKAWRVAGPARMSLADRGITFATNAEVGLCVTFVRPVPGIDPFGILTHPTLTVTVDDPEALAVAIGIKGALPHTDLAHGSLSGVIRALRRSLIRHRSVDVAAQPEVVVAPPADLPEDGQSADTGVGPWFHRRYRARIDRPTLAPERLIDAIVHDPNVIADTSLAPFVKDQGDEGSMSVGDRYTVRTAGPWEGPVEVVEVGPDHVRFATLDGHMEAGIIDFHAAATADGAGSIDFEIESWARSGDRAFHVLYDVVGVAKTVQTEMWVTACERAAERAGGTLAGPVEILETRTPPRDRRP